MKADRNLYRRKTNVLTYYRARGNESLAEISQTYGSAQFRSRASAINTAIQQTRDKLIASLKQTARNENWRNEDIVNNVLMLSHCCNVVMIEFRNAVWPYEYMAFSRRIGELWEPFCAVCFEHAVRDDTRLFVPPLFQDVRENLTQEIRDFIQGLPITDEQREELLR